jgi:hypothetical protein
MEREIQANVAVSGGKAAKQRAAPRARAARIRAFNPLLPSITQLTLWMSMHGRN